MRNMRWEEGKEEEKQGIQREKGRGKGEGKEGGKRKEVRERGNTEEGGERRFGKGET